MSIGRFIIIIIILKHSKYFFKRVNKGLKMLKKKKIVRFISNLINRLVINYNLFKTKLEFLYV